MNHYTCINIYVGFVNADKVNGDDLAKLIRHRSEENAAELSQAFESSHDAVCVHYFLLGDLLPKRSRGDSCGVSKPLFYEACG